MQKQAIKKRASYWMFKDMHHFLETKPSEEEILEGIWMLLDKRRAFGSQENADAARESLELVLAEAKERQGQKA
ncbi:hypothetical protein COU79_00195 [Candidatus Peregrinibacteria bacterium CG10_big_fil_rev_8_21_14_0_10_54_7]|nr:MAG: hypothetical protein COU79_00195 [Candidatus Peregrinibacteria bacterium CG10_big_fil_rev_8_21_14_0_10_54_7]